MNLFIILSSISDDWVCVTPGKFSEHLVSVVPLIKRIPIRQLSHCEQCALQKHLRRSYTVPLEVDTFLSMDAFRMDVDIKVEEEATSSSSSKVDSGPESVVSSSVAMEQDSDSGKGTQRSESSAASPVSCKSDVRKMKRKSKSLCSETSEPTTDDSGLPPKTAKKLVKDTSGEGDKTEVVKKKKKQSVINKKAEKPQQQSTKEAVARKKSQYSKSNKKTDSNNHCPKPSNAKKEHC